MTITTLVLFVLGGAMLVAGAEALVRGASRLALAMRITPLVVGLTVVAFGTSAPELAVNVAAGLSGQPDVAVGNVVGSNIFNILFILGLSALVAPLVVAQQLVRLDVPVLIGVSIAVWVFALDGGIEATEGGLLFTGIVVYTVFLVRKSRSERPEIAAEYEEAFVGDTAAVGRGGRAGLVRDIGYIVVGLALLVAGAQLLVTASVDAARALGVSELVIGLTIVAAGTSLPEVATSVVATLRGERDLAVGNVVGSNLFNLMCVFGLTSIVAPGGLPVASGALAFDIPVMVAVAVAALPIFFTGYRIARWEGLLFLGYYAAYVTYLVLDATAHPALGGFTVATAFFVVPLTVVTLAVVTVRSIRRGDGSR